MSENQEGQAGVEEVAILLMSLDPDEAADIMQHLGPKQVQMLGSAMASVKNVSKEKYTNVLGTFFDRVDKQTSIGVSSNEYIKSVLVKALGEEKASTILDKIFVDGVGGNNRGLETLRWLEPRGVADIIKNEHPQIMSLIVSYLEPEQAAEVLKFFDERTRVDLVMRIASQESVQPVVFKELNYILEKVFQGTAISASKEVGGVKVAANIMNFVDTTSEQKIMGAINEKDTDMASKIQDLMFVFDDLYDVDDRGMQTILREVNNETLLLALKGCDEKMKEKIFTNMSQRAAELLKDDLEAKGPVRLSEVETAQKEILVIARRLADEGQIALNLGGEDML